MKNKSLLLVTTALLILPIGNSAFATGDAGMSGSLELGARLADGEDDSAKFMEYMDLDSGVIGNFMYNYYRDALFFDIEATNIGLDDQYYSFKGGMYNAFRFWLFYDEIPHNLSFGARTFYSGLGSGDLNIAVSPADESTWRTFDYAIDTQKYGGGAEFFRSSPFFVKFSVTREEKEGLRPLGSGSFSGVVELQEPVDYTTNNFMLSSGYRSDTISYKLAGLFSSFTNDNEALEWDNPFIGITEHNSLAQDSDYAKIDADLTWRQLPLMSTLMVRGSYTNLSSDFNVNDIGGFAPFGLNSDTFDGDITTTRFSAALTSMPAKKFDTRLFFEYYDRTNDSTIIDYADGSNEDHLFEYSKYNLGFDVNYNLASHSKLSGGYKFEDVDRTNRDDAESTQDNLFFVKLKNNSLELLTAKVEYSYLDRSTDEGYDFTGVTPLDAEYIHRFQSRFDAASKTKNAIKFALEFYPFERLDFGTSYTYVMNDYDEAVLGRTEDTGHEIYLDFTWRAAKILTMNGFAGYENYSADSNHYNWSPGQVADPTIDDGNPGSYRWSQFIDEDFWTIGLGAKMPLMSDRLILSLMAQYQESDGASDFTTEGLSALQPIDDYEDYYITTFEAKVIYSITEAIALKVGYLYEKSNYDDLQYDGYKYRPGGTYLSGAGADNDYEAHVGYVTVKYTF